MPAEEYGATYAMPIIYVSLLTIAHVLAFYLLVHLKAAWNADGDAAAS